MLPPIKYLKRMKPTLEYEVCSTGFKETPNMLLDNITTLTINIQVTFAV